MRKISNLLVTGGCGFIGSNFIRYLLADPLAGFKGRIVNLDKLTYAGDPENLAGVSSHPRYAFVQGDVCDEPLMAALLEDYAIDAICHFAAESHVDNSIKEPGAFVRSNIFGVYSLLEAMRKSRRKIHLHLISTDEVYGSLQGSGAFIEESPYRPNNPYSASKASGDHLARAYAHTYGLSVTISNCSNNYGPYQAKEKFIPTMICSMLNRQPIPIYGNGDNVRDWIHVQDHNRAAWLIMRQAASGQSYNIGGNNEWSNIGLARLLCRLAAQELGAPAGELEKLIVFVADRPGHDLRYAINANKLRKDFNWRPAIGFENGLAETARWHIARQRREG